MSQFIRSWGWRLVWWESNNKEEKPNNTKCKTPFIGEGRLLVRQCQRISSEYNYRLIRYDEIQDEGYNKQSL
jgi:hypothetical protein